MSTNFSESEKSTSDQNMADPVDKVQFLESLVSQYESLVQDMTTELNVFHSSLKTQHVLVDTEDTNNQQDLDLDLQHQLSVKEAIIHNLLMQVSATGKSKAVTKALWQATLEHVESLETTKATLEKGTPSTSGLSLSHSLSSDFLNRYKLLQSYAESLEKRVGRCTKEAAFYKKKIMDIRLEYRTLEEKYRAEKTQCVQDAKASYAREIEYLKSTIEKMRQDFHVLFDKRLSEEKEAWEYLEAKRLQLVRVKVQELLVQNEALELRDREYATIVQNLEAELRDTKAQIIHTLDNLVPSMSNYEPLDPISQNGNEQESQMKAPDRSYPVKKLESTSTPVQTDNDFIPPDQFIRFQKSQKQLESEYQRLKLKLDATEVESLSRTSRLQTRIQEMEALNATIQTQYRNLTEKFDALRKRSRSKDGRYLEKNHFADKECEDDMSDPSIDMEVKQDSPKITKEEVDSRLKFVNEPLPRPWVKDDLNEIEMESERIDRRTKEVQIGCLSYEIKRLKEEREKLLEVAEKQKSIAAKWKTEFKELAKRTMDY